MLGEDQRRECLPVHRPLHLLLPHALAPSTQCPARRHLQCPFAIRDIVSSCGVGFIVLAVDQFAELSAVLFFSAAACSSNRRLAPKIWFWKCSGCAHCHSAWISSLSA